MKHVLLLIVSAVLLMTASLSPASARPDGDVTVKAESETVASVFSKIEQSAGYSFLWNSEIEPLLSREVSVNVQNQSIESTLDTVLSGLGLSYKISGRQVVISKAPAAQKVQQEAPQKLTGTVISSSDNQPVAGAAVCGRD